MADDVYGTMEAYTTIFDGLVYLGPGDRETTTALAVSLRPKLPRFPRIADFGSGVGASALELARALPRARVLALDSHAPFIARLRKAAAEQGLAERVNAMEGDMSNPPPLDGLTGEFDLIWSESAIYVLGRRQALSLWRPLLRPGAWLVFTDIVWRRRPAERSTEAVQFWAVEYPNLDDPDNVMGELNAAGFRPRGPMYGTERAWSNYYVPLRTRLAELKRLGGTSTALCKLIGELEREIEVHGDTGHEVALCYFTAQR